MAIPSTTPIEMSEPEEWRPAPGFPLYETSNLGRVRRIRYVPVVGEKDPHGYYRANLVRGESRKHKHIHQMVAEAYLGPCPLGMEVAHLDGNPRNNCVANLTYTTHRENIGHKVVHGTAQRGEKAGSAKLSADDVRWIRANYMGKTTDFGAIALAARFGVSRTTIWSIANGRGWDQVEATDGDAHPDRARLVEARKRRRERGRRERERKALAR